MTRFKGNSKRQRRLNRLQQIKDAAVRLGMSNNSIGTTKGEVGMRPTELAPGEHRVLIAKDTALDFPELWLEVWLTGTPFEQKQFAEMFARARCYKAKSPETADLVVFAGGEDVNPALYGEMAHSSVHHSESRDKADLDLYKKCYENGIPMFGVCRGFQFLHVMNGGKLYQDVDHHQGQHQMFDKVGRRTINNISSVHHQMVRPFPDMTVIGHVSRSTKRWTNDNNFLTGPAVDIEAAFYRDTCCLGVQGHPEYRGYAEYTSWCLKMIDKFINENPDLTISDVGRNRRMKPEFMMERELRKAAKISMELN